MLLQAHARKLLGGQPRRIRSETGQRPREPEAIETISCITMRKQHAPSMCESNEMESKLPARRRRAASNKGGLVSPTRERYDVKLSMSARSCVSPHSSVRPASYQSPLPRAMYTMHAGASAGEP